MHNSDNSTDIYLFIDINSWHWGSIFTGPSHISDKSKRSKSL